MPYTGHMDEMRTYLKRHGMSDEDIDRLQEFEACIKPKRRRKAEPQPMLDLFADED